MSAAGEMGRFGEDLAERFLREKGYAILTRNYHCRYGEIDLIARDGDSIVFVEVKLRRDARFMAAAEAVGYAKQQKLRSAAACWLAARGDVPARFDILEIYVGKPQDSAVGPAYRPIVRHIKNAF